MRNNIQHSLKKYFFLTVGLLFLIPTNTFALLTYQPQYNYTSSVISLTVPAAVTQIRATARGADGGLTTGSGNGLGSGAQAQAFFPVTPGDIITAIVGQAAGASGDLDACGGGGSGVFISSLTANAGLALLAGAGGEVITRVMGMVDARLNLVQLG